MMIESILDEQIHRGFGSGSMLPNCPASKTSKNLDEVLRKEAGCTTELDYTEQTSWLLFLKYLDSRLRRPPCTRPPREGLADVGVKR